MAAGACVGLLLLDAVVLKPVAALWKRQSERIASAGALVDSGRQLLDRRAAVEEQWGGMVAAGLPATSSDAETLVLGAVSDWRRASGLNLTNIRPRWITGDKVGDRLELRLTGEGNLESVTRFLYEAEVGPLPIRIEDVELRPRGESAAELTLDLRLSALRIRKGNRP
jgi:hypothetical protein